MATQNRHGRANLRHLFSGLEDEPEELAERLEFGDNESVLAWFHYHCPSATVRVVSEQRRTEFIGLVRGLYEDERDA
jgi:hypothetical protein